MVIYIKVSEFEGLLRIRDKLNFIY